MFLDNNVIVAMDELLNIDVCECLALVPVQPRKVGSASYVQRCRMLAALKSRNARTSNGTHMIRCVDCVRFIATCL